MSEQLLALSILLSPLGFIITSLISWFQPGFRPAMLKKIAITSATISIGIAVACSVLVVQYGVLETDFIGIANIGLSLRLDSVSIIMFAMIALLSFIIIRYSLNYLDGDGRQGAFIGRLSATIASAQLLVLSGNLGILFLSWVLTSITLHRLLIFYHDRPGAVIAARKKFLIARLADVCVLAAIIGLYQMFGTGNFGDIFDALKTNGAADLSINGLEIIALLFAAAAILKSAQFPTHGWLIEVMETPTPVSALLHAGVLNAGPFLIIRMAYIFDATTFASAALIIIGGFTALFASVVYLTQTSVKTALGYSSVAHMGFSLLVCGLGVFPAAMLHLVAHSFYKAHSFLSSGSVIDLVQSAKISSAKRLGSPLRIGLGIILAFSVYTGFAMVWGIDPETELALFAIGAIIVMGLSRLFTTALDSKVNFKLTLSASLLAVIVAATFFALESGAHYLIASQIPELSNPTSFETSLISAILISYTIVVLIQILAPLYKSKPIYTALAVHLRNGLYANALFDRMVGALYSYGKPGDELINSTDLSHQKVTKTEKFEEQTVGVTTN